MAVMAVGLPVICPVLLYEKSSGHWVCGQPEEYEVLRDAGWPTGFCNGAYTERPDYLKCPAFSHWFWREVARQIGKVGM